MLLARLRVLDLTALGGDTRFVTDAGRVAHRAEVVAAIAGRLATRPTHEWLTQFAAGAGR